MTNGKKVQFGLFGGYSQNMGACDSIVSFKVGDVTTSRGSDIKRLYRISPRVVFIAGKFQFMTELEYTVAYYVMKKNAGVIDRDAKGVIGRSADVGNLRALFAVQFNF